ncbi:MAG: radical SAM protein, partial [Spirochaetaceae bacterium]|nr:radical SAM protein [Spirochaetaceae bacterium]
MTKFFLDQHGCAKNQVDGELLIHRLVSRGMTQVFDAGEADLIVVNSCGFIESAKTESLEAVLGAKKVYPNAKVLLSGCLAERYAEVFRTELPEVDGILGNGDLSAIDGVVDDMEKNERPVVKKAQVGVCCGERNMLLSFRGSAYVKITEGCNNNCSYCAIPIIRGELRSRKASEIVDEIKELLAKGIFEFNLVGQDLAAYGTG